VVNGGTTAPVEGAAPTPTANHPLPSERDNPRQFACLIASTTVTMSDGSQFAGILATSNTSSAISGLNIVTAQALTSAKRRYAINRDNRYSRLPIDSAEFSL
jgi:hypothetical protein